MASTVSWPTSWLLNTDWNDTPSVPMVENQPEFGPSIRRVRSHNVKHTLSCSVDMTYSQISTDLPGFLYSIAGGVDTFNFKSPVDSTTYDAKIEGSNGQFYTVKRKDPGLYTVTFKVSYYKLGVF